MSMEKVGYMKLMAVLAIVHNTKQQHNFGLGSATKVDSLQIIWPGGNQQSVYDIEANQSLIVLEDTAVSDTTTHINELSLTNHPVSVVPNPNSGTFTVDFYSQWYQRDHIESF